MGSIPDWRTKIPHAVWHGQKIKKQQNKTKGTKVLRASKLLPIRNAAGLLMAPPNHLTHDLAADKSPWMSNRGWVWGVAVVLPSREPCKELGLGFPSDNLSS